MNDRLRKARRMLAIQAELDRFADWTLIDLERRRTDVEDRRAKLIGFLEAESAVGGIFAGAMLRRLESIEKSCAALRAERDAQAEKRVAERARLRAAEAVFEAIRTGELRREERLRLFETIEASLNRFEPASGKLSRSS